MLGTRSATCAQGRMHCGYCIEGAHGARLTVQCVSDAASQRACRCLRRASNLQLGLDVGLRRLRGGGGEAGEDSLHQLDRGSLLALEL